MYSNKNLLLTVFLFFSFFTLTVKPQSDETLYQQLKSNFKKDYFNVEILLQTLFDYQGDRIVFGNNGFSVPNARFRVRGILDKGFRYDFQINMISQNPLIDASVSYKYSDAFMVDAGMFKSPFSYEFLLSENEIDFVNRSTVSEVLGTKRQVGLKARGNLAGKLLKYHGGIFNGRAIGANVGDKFPLFILRLESNPELNIGSSKGELVFGGNVAYNKADNASYINGLLSNFFGNRLLIGADFRFTLDKLMLSAEYIRGEYKPETGNKTVSQGFHLTGGYFVLENTQVLARLDNFKPTENLKAQNLFLIGINQKLSEPAALQFNYIIDTDNSKFDYNRLLLVFQIFI